VKATANGDIGGQPIDEPGIIHIRTKGDRMQISDTMNAAFNDQITMEFQAAHNYLAMGAWLESAGFSGMSAWMQAQSAEETTHAMKFYQFVLDRGGRVVLGSLEAPPSEFDSVAAVFAAALAQEQDVSAAINNLYAAATEDRDFASVPLLDWFVTEQIEEEATFSQILDDLALAEGGPQALLFLDREFGARGTAE
jgi:ferritin